MVNLGRFGAQPIRQMSRVGMITNAIGVEQNPNITWYVGYDRGSDDNGNRFLFYFYCNGTETTIDITLLLNLDFGIFDLYLNGVLDTAGFDTYAAVLGPGGFVVGLTTDTIPGINTVEFRVNGRNGASTGWRLMTGGVRLR